MFFSKSKIKAQTSKAVLVSKTTGTFHELRKINGREKVCKIYYISEGWVPKSLCTENDNSLEVPDKFINTKEKIA